MGDGKGVREDLVSFDTMGLRERMTEDPSKPVIARDHLLTSNPLSLFGPIKEEILKRSSS